MFRLIGLWIAWLRSGSVLLHTEPIASTTTQISSADATETVVGSYTLPGGTIPATGKFRLRIRGTYHANATANATSIAVWVRIGTTTLAGDLFLQTGFTPAGTAGSVSFEIEISGESDGGTSTEGVAEQRVVLWDGTPGGTSRASAPPRSSTYPAAWTSTTPRTTSSRSRRPGTTSPRAPRWAPRGLPRRLLPRQLGHRHEHLSHIRDDHRQGGPRHASRRAGRRPEPRVVPAGLRRTAPGT